MSGKGFTLVELLVVLALAGILAAMAIPAFGGLVQDERRRVLANELLSALRMARSEAIVRHTPVVVRAFGEGWSRGWVVMLDVRGTRNQRGEILRRYVQDGSTRVIGNQWVEREVRFNVLGAPANTRGSANAGSIFLCDSGTRRMRSRVVIAWAGRVRIADDSDEADPCQRPTRSP